MRNDTIHPSHGEDMSTATVTTLTNKSTVSQVFKLHEAVFGVNFEDRKYSQKRPDFHLANLKACLTQKRVHAYCERFGFDMSTVTLGQLAGVMGEMKIAQRLAIVQSGQCDTLAMSRGSASLVAAWVASHEIVWSEPEKVVKKKAPAKKKVENKSEG